MTLPALLGGVGAALSGVGAVGSLFGGSGKSYKNENQQMQEQLGFSHDAQMRSARQLPLAMRQGWEAAGIHPIYGLGGSSSSFSPSFSTAGGGGERSLGERMQSAGAGISRAAEAFNTTRERLANRLLETQIEGQELENTRKASQLALNSQAGTPPPMPMVNDVALDRIVSRNGHSEPAAVTDLGFTNTGSGGRAPVKSKDATERLEDDFLGNLAWNLRNRILPSVGANQSPPDEILPKGYKWIYNPFKQEYTIQKRSRFGIYY